MSTPYRLLLRMGLFYRPDQSPFLLQEDKIPEDENSDTE